MYDIVKEVSEKVILVAVTTGSCEAAERSLDELSDLVKTAGAETVARVIQERDSIHPLTYMGTGKIDEVKTLINSLEATGIVCDDELSPTQMKNLEDALDCKVLDRTLVILDIFAKHATTAEGKIQVEMAQLKYASTRLAGFGKAMSRLGGGIGTRGPGETKIETDRRQIRNRIAILNRDLKNVVRSREVTRAGREKNNMPVFAIVGYTNAGKSTFLNKLTGASVLSEDKLFATLDPTTRGLKLPSGGEILLTDTVGFINKLPHHFVEAFKSTLEEAKYADVIIHVVDGSNEDFNEQMETVYNTLKDLKVQGKPIITLFNKCDKGFENGICKDANADKVIRFSAKTGEGIEAFYEAVEELQRRDKVLVDKVIAFTEASKLQLIRKYGQIILEEYTEDGVHVKAYVPENMK